MSTSDSKIVIPPAAGYLVYKAFKNGYFGDIRDKLFGHHTGDNIESQKFGNESLGDNAFSTPNDMIDIEEADTIHGKPAENVVFDPSVYQYYDDTCAIQSQHLILQQYGIDVTQEEMIEVAKENGWYAEGHGTPMGMIGKLLEYYGVDISGTYGNNIFNLSNELAQGHQVIVSVDEYELVYPDETKDWDELYGEEANHALVVVGIDTSDPDNVQVIVTDPGTGNRQMAYPAEQFINAWKDSECFMVTTNDVPTVAPLYPYTPIDVFGGIPTETLHRLSGMDIDVSRHDEYSSFVEDLLNNPGGFEDLLAQYEDLFVHEPDNVFEDSIVDL